MKDAARILDKLLIVWDNQPDSRLMQLFCTFLLKDHYTSFVKGMQPFLKDPFYLEDNLIEDKLDALLEKVGHVKGK